MNFLKKHICCKMLHSVSFFYSLKENWSDSVDTLRSLASLILSWNEKEKQPRSFLHRNIPGITNHDQAAVEKLEHTLAKLRHTGTLIGQECPTIEVNWQVDPRFASKRNVSGKTEKVINEHSFSIAYHQYASNTFTMTIIYQRYKAPKDISIN